MDLPPHWKSHNWSQKEKNLLLVWKNQPNLEQRIHESTGSPFERPEDDLSKSEGCGNRERDMVSRVDSAEVVDIIGEGTSPRNGAEEEPHETELQQVVKEQNHHFQLFFSCTKSSELDWQILYYYEKSLWKRTSGGVAISAVGVESVAFFSADILGPFAEHLPISFSGIDCFRLFLIFVIFSFVHPAIEIDLIQNIL